MEPIGINSICCSTVPPPELQQQAAAAVLPDLAKNVSNRYVEVQYWGGGGVQNFPLGEILTQARKSKKRKKFTHNKHEEQEDEVNEEEEQAQWCFFNGNEEELYSANFGSNPRSLYPTTTASGVLLYPNSATLASTITCNNPNPNLRTTLNPNPSPRLTLNPSCPNSSAVPLSPLNNININNNNTNKLILSSSKKNVNINIIYNNSSSSSSCCSSADAYMTSSLCNVNLVPNNNNNIILNSDNSNSSASTIPSIAPSSNFCSVSSSSSSSASVPLLAASSSNSAVLLQSHSQHHHLLQSTLYNPSRSKYTTIQETLNEPLGNGVLHGALNSCSSSLFFSSNNASIKPYPISMYNNNNCVHASSDTSLIPNTNHSVLTGTTTNVAPLMQKTLALASSSANIINCVDPNTNSEPVQQTIASSSPASLLYTASIDQGINLTTEYFINEAIQANSNHDHLQLSELNTLNRSTNHEADPTNPIIITTSCTALLIPPQNTIAKPQTPTPHPQNPNPSAFEYSSANPSSSSSSSKATATQNPNPKPISNTNYNTTPATSSNPNPNKQNPRNKVSVHPQGIAARRRRHRISHKFKILQTLVPGGTKMDTASMLDEAIHYIKYLRGQILLHQLLEAASSHSHGINQVNLHHQQQPREGMNVHNVENIPFESSLDASSGLLSNHENQNLINPANKVKSSTISDFNTNYSLPVNPNLQSPNVNFHPRIISSCSNNSSIAFPSSKNLAPNFIPM